MGQGFSLPRPFILLSSEKIKRPEYVLRHLIRFILAKTAVGHCLEIMTAIFKICGGITQTVMSGLGGSISTAATLPSEIVTEIEGAGPFAVGLLYEKTYRGFGTVPVTTSWFG